MTMKSILTALAVYALAGTAAEACDGQAGTTIFEDTFADDSGGWDLSPPGNLIKAPDFIFTLNKATVASSAQNLTFSATVAEYCADFVLPKAPATDNNATAGVIFWAVDYSNYMLAQVGSDSRVSFWKKSAGNWTQLFAVATTPAFKPAPDAVNSLHVVATKDQKIQISLNGTAIKTIRAEMPTGQLHFGVFAELDKAPADDTVIRFKAFKVTSGN